MLPFASDYISTDWSIPFHSNIDVFSPYRLLRYILQNSERYNVFFHHQMFQIYLGIILNCNVTQPVQHSPCPVWVTDNSLFFTASIRLFKFQAIAPLAGMDKAKENPIYRYLMLICMFRCNLWWTIHFLPSGIAILNSSLNPPSVRYARWFLVICHTQ